MKHKLDLIKGFIRKLTLALNPCGVKIGIDYGAGAALVSVHDEHPLCEDSTVSICGPRKLLAWKSYQVGFGINFINLVIKMIEQCSCELSIVSHA